MKKLVAVLALAWGLAAHASMTVDGVWATGVWNTTTWADGVWREGEPTAPAVDIGTPSFFPIELAEKLPWLDSDSCPDLTSNAVTEAATNGVWARRGALNQLRVNPMAVPGCARPAVPAP